MLYIGFFLFFFQYCFEIYSADNSSGLIKACKTDSEGKVVEGQKVSINEKKLTPIVVCIDWDNCDDVLQK